MCVSDSLCCTAKTNTSLVTTLQKKKKISASLVNYTPKKKKFFSRESLYGPGLSGGSLVKNPPAKQETRDQSLGWKNPLAKETATHSRILAWRIPWTEEPGGLLSMGRQRVRYNLETTPHVVHLQLIYYCIPTILQFKNKIQV